MAHPPTHEQQLKLRETIQLAGQKLAAVLQRFEELTGHTVRGVSVARYPSGKYCAQVLIGGAPRPIAEPLAAAAPPAPTASATARSEEILSRHNTSRD